MYRVTYITRKINVMHACIYITYAGMQTEIIAYMVINIGC